MALHASARTTVLRPFLPCKLACNKAGATKTRCTCCSHHYTATITTTRTRTSTLHLGHDATASGIMPQVQRASSGPKMGLKATPACGDMSQGPEDRPRSTGYSWAALDGSYQVSVEEVRPVCACKTLLIFLFIKPPGKTFFHVWSQRTRTLMYRACRSAPTMHTPAVLTCSGGL